MCVRGGLGDEAGAWRPAVRRVVELLTSTDPQLRALVEQLRIFVAPVINPDGCMSPLLPPAAVHRSVTAAA